MHFWVSATRGGMKGGFSWPRKYGTNWFMPALVNSKFGALGRKLAEGTIVCCFPLKKSKNDCLIADAFMISGLVPSREDPRKTAVSQVRAEIGEFCLPANVWKFLERVVYLDLVIPDLISADVALNCWPAKNLSHA